MKVLMLVPLLLALACGGSGHGREVGVAAHGAMDAEQATGQILYLDVRTPEEWQAGHVQGAVLIPVDQLERRWAELEAYRDQPVVIYCRSGRRAETALAVLQAHGFSKVVNGGGLEQLAAARGLRVVTGEQ